MLRNTPTNIDSYIASFPKETQKQLQQIRTIIKKAAPKTQEVISYQMPAFKMNSVLVFFAGYKNHIGFYPCASGIEKFQSEFKKYKWSKGAVQFPLDQPLPATLITKMVKFRLAEDIEKAKSKTPKKEKSSVKKSSDTEEVTKHIKKLPADIAKTVETIRLIILSTDKEIGERIKWNNPSFYYTGKMKPFNPKEYKNEIAVFNLFKGRIMLVFPSGAKVNDTSGLLTGDYKDGRRIAIFKDLKDAKAREKDLKKVLKKWLSLVEK